jgi:hypothetical protein
VTKAHKVAVCEATLEEKMGQENLVETPLSSNE